MSESTASAERAALLHEFATDVISGFLDTSNPICDKIEDIIDISKLETYHFTRIEWKKFKEGIVSWSIVRTFNK